MRWFTRQSNPSPNAWLKQVRVCLFIPRHLASNFSSFSQRSRAISLFHSTVAVGWIGLVEAKPCIHQMGPSKDRRPHKYNQ
jgi:hypothetical protein